MQTLGDGEEKHGGLKGAPGGLMVEADSRQARTIDGSPSKGVVGAQERLLQEKPRTGSRGSPGEQDPLCPFPLGDLELLPTCPGLAVSLPPFQPWGDGMEMGSV